MALFEVIRQYKNDEWSVSRSVNNFHARVTLQKLVRFPRRSLRNIEEKKKWRERADDSWQWWGRDGGEERREEKEDNGGEGAGR